MIDVDTFHNREKAAGREFKVYFNNPKVFKASYSKLLELHEVEF